MISVYLVAASAFIVIWLYLGASAFSDSRKLLSGFRSAYPVEASREGLTAAGRSPKKTLYFLSPQSHRVLIEKKDEALLALRRSFVFRIRLLLSLHFGGVLVLAIAFMLART